MRKRIALIGVNLAIVLAVVGGTIAYASMSKTVTLSIDGQSQEVKTFADNVAGVLEEEDIEVGEHDVVAPGLDSELDEGAKIAVRYGRELTVTKDGETKTYWVTATNVQDALAQLDLRVVDSAELSASRGAAIGREGFELTISTPKRVTLIVGDGERKKVVTTAATVAELLTERDVALDKHDRIAAGIRQSSDRDSGAPGNMSRREAKVAFSRFVVESVKADEPIVAGMRIEVTRIGFEVKTVKVSVPYDTIVRTDDDLFEDQVQVKREGVEGVKRVTYRIRSVNGDVAKRVELKSAVLDKPKAQVEIHGTKARPEPEPNYEDGDTVWDQLAECESGGDWAINTGNGYYGGLQFSLSTWQAYGGTGYPHENSREQQIAIAERVRDANGGSYGSWPGCASALGLPM